MSEIKYPDLKLVSHNAARYHNAEADKDPAYPFRLEVVLRAPSFMEMAFVFTVGATEELVVRSKTMEGLEPFIVDQNFRKHPRLIRMVVTGPEGEIERVAT